MKDILSWNVACVMQSIWSILTKAGSLWIAWLEAYVLKGRSFWQVLISFSYSWNMRKFLQLRIITYNFVEWKDGVEVWKLGGSKYSTVVVWSEIRPKMEKKEWHRLVDRKSTRLNSSHRP